MKNNAKLFINEEIEIRHILSSDVDFLMNAGFDSGRKELSPSFTQSFLQSVRLVPRKTKLVAYSTKKKRAVSFLSLFEHTPQISSIKYVYTDPKFRNMGIATGLIKHALDIAKKRGANKVFLNYDSNKSYLMNFYNNFGFTLITETKMLWGCGFISKYQNPHNAEKLFMPNANSTDRKLLFSIYERCMGNNWVGFFENNAKNITNGFSQDFRYLYLKDVLVSKSRGFFALVFKRPISHQAIIELYSPPNSNLQPILEELFSILRMKGINFIKINIFNLTDEQCFKFLQEKGFNPFQSRIMGKYF